MNPVWRFARKDHECTLCAYTIPKGARYRYEKLTPWDHPDNDGYFTYKGHYVCERAWRDIGREWDWAMPDVGEWRQYLSERYGLPDDRIEAFVNGQYGEVLGVESA